MRRANSPLVQRLQSKYASQSKVSAPRLPIFEVRVQEMDNRGKWRTVENRKMSLEDIQLFKGEGGDFDFDDNQMFLLITDNDESQQLKLNLNKFIGRIISGRR